MKTLMTFMALFVPLSAFAVTIVVFELTLAIVNARGWEAVALFLAWLVMVAYLALLIWVQIKTYREYPE